MKTFFFVPSKRKKKTKTKKKNIETHDFSTPTEWNVEMVNDKVIVTLSGEIHFFLLDYFYLGRKNGGGGGGGLDRSCQLPVWD